MSKASLRQATRLLQLVDETGWTAEEVNECIIEQWGLLRYVAEMVSEHSQFEERIRSLLSGFDVRIYQARVLFDHGWGQVVGAVNFSQYLASIPAVPTWPTAWKGRFDRTVLVDPRGGLAQACRMGAIAYDDSMRSFVTHKSVPEPRISPYWIRCQKGTLDQRSQIERWKGILPTDELSMVVIEGVALQLQDPVALLGYSMYLLGSVSSFQTEQSALLYDWGGIPKLTSRFPDSHHGVATRGKL